jgi:hypothetical protein
MPQRPFQYQVRCLSFLVWGEVALGKPATNWLIVPAPDNKFGAVGGMTIRRGNRSTRRKLARVPLCPPQIPHSLTWARTRPAAGH